MRVIAQNYKTGELSLLDMPMPSCQSGGVLVRTEYSVISPGTEMMKVAESKLSLLGKARARPDQVKKVLDTIQQQGIWATYRKVMNKLDSYTPLGYALSGIVEEVGAGVTEFHVGQRVACAGNKYALHAEYNWVPTQLTVAVPEGVPAEHAAFATVASIALHGLRQADMQVGETACVIGLGLLGQILVQLLRASGVFCVGLDLSDQRCRLAESAGAAACGMMGQPSGDAVVAALAKLTDGQGADAVFLTAASKDNGPTEIAAELARDRGRVVDVGKCRLDLPWNAYYDKELEVRFSRSYGPGRYDPVYEEMGIDYPIGYVRWTERRNMMAVLAMIESGRLDLDTLINQRLPFADAVSIYEKLNKGELSGLGILFEYEQDRPRDRRMVLRSSTSRPAAAQKAVTLGVIGCGNYASSQLLPHLVDRSDVRLVEVVTNTPLSAANAAKKFGFERVATESAGLIESDEINAVLIATRHASHADLTCKALRAGKAVFVEKPLAISREQLDMVKRTVEETGNDRLMVGFNRRFSPMLQSLKKAWGPRTDAHVLQYRIHAGSLESGSWYANIKDEGTRFAGEGGHFIDTVAWWLDLEPDQVFALAAANDPDNLTSVLRFPNGSIATITYLTRGDNGVPKEYLEIFGEGKAARFENFRRYELWRGGKAQVEKSQSIDKGQKAEMDAFVAAVLTGSPMPIPLASLYATTLASLGVHESVASSAPVLLAPAAAPGRPLALVEA